MDGAIDVLLNQKIINGLDIFVFPSVGRPNDSTDTDGILVNQVDRFLRVDHVAIFGAKTIAFFNFKVACCFLPTDLDSRVHDDVGLRVVLAGCFTLVLPALFHGESTKDLRTN